MRVISIADRGGAEDIENMKRHESWKEKTHAKSQRIHNKRHCRWQRAGNE